MRIHDVTVTGTLQISQCAEEKLSQGDAEHMAVELWMRLSLVTRASHYKVDKTMEWQAMFYSDSAKDQVCKT